MQIKVIHYNVCKVQKWRSNLLMTNFMSNDIGCSEASINNNKATAFPATHGLVVSNACRI